MKAAALSKCEDLIQRNTCKNSLRSSKVSEGGGVGEEGETSETGSGKQTRGRIGEGRWGEIGN